MGTAVLETREVWSERLKSEEEKLGFSDGYKFLYAPWHTIGLADTFFLSLNPGRPPRDANLFTLSDERGNSYEVERSTTASPITEQFLRLAGMLSLRPSDIPAGAAIPFRTRRWSEFSGQQKRAAMTIGHEFWAQVFAVRRPLANRRAHGHSTPAIALSRPQLRDNRTA